MFFGEIEVCNGRGSLAASLRKKKISVAPTTKASITVIIRRRIALLNLNPLYGCTTLRPNIMTPCVAHYVIDGAYFIGSYFIIGIQLYKVGISRFL